MIRPLENRILVKMKEYLDKTKSGIILSSTSKEMPQVAKVIEVGTNVEYIKKGDTVIVDKYAGTEVQYEGVEYVVLKLENILAIVN